MINLFIWTVSAIFVEYSCFDYLFVMRSFIRVIDSSFLLSNVVAMIQKSRRNKRELREYDELVTILIQTTLC